MKTITYVCDECRLAIDGSTTPETGNIRMAGGIELCELKYIGVIGHNRFPNEGLHYHYICFCKIVDRILTDSKSN